jgi:hypothetical protein
MARRSRRFQGAFDTASDAKASGTRAGSSCWAKGGHQTWLPSANPTARRRSEIKRWPAAPDWATAFRFPGGGRDDMSRLLTWMPSGRCASSMNRTKKSGSFGAVDLREKLGMGMGAHTGPPASLASRAGRTWPLAAREPGNRARKTATRGLAAWRARLPRQSTTLGASAPLSVG